MSQFPQNGGSGPMVSDPLPMSGTFFPANPGPFVSGPSVTRNSGCRQRFLVMHVQDYRVYTTDGTALTLEIDPRDMTDLSDLEEMGLFYHTTPDGLFSGYRVFLFDDSTRVMRSTSRYWKDVFAKKRGMVSSYSIDDLSSKKLADDQYASDIDDINQKAVDCLVRFFNDLDLPFNAEEAQQRAARLSKSENHVARECVDFRGFVNFLRLGVFSKGAVYEQPALGEAYFSFDPEVRTVIFHPSRLTPGAPELHIPYEDFIRKVVLPDKVTTHGHNARNIFEPTSVTVTTSTGSSDFEAIFETLGNKVSAADKSNTDCWVFDSRGAVHSKHVKQYAEDKGDFI